MHELIFAAMVFFLSTASAFADGDCPPRPATQQEQAAYSSAHAAAIAAVQPPPKDWLVTDKTDGLSICERHGTNDGPIWYWFKFDYKYDETVKSKAEQARITELEKKEDELVKARKQARRSGNNDELNRIEGDLKAVRGEIRKLKEDINNAYMQKMMSGELRDKMKVAGPANDHAEVIIKVNEDHAWISPQNAPFNVTGSGQGYWSMGENEHAVILLGEWEPKTFKSKWAKATVITKPQTIIIEIYAEREIAEKIARDMKLDRLREQIR